MRQRIHPVQMLLVFALFLLRCDTHWPYQPEPFMTPTPKPGLPYVVPRETIRQFLSTTNAKIAFLSGGGAKRAIEWVDYNETDSIPSPRKLRMPYSLDQTLVYPPEAPMISPDGEWVAYFISDNATTSITFVQKLDTASSPFRFADNAAHPHWWKDPDGKLFLIYCSRASGNVELDDGSTTMQQVDQIDPTTKVGTAETLVQDAFNGGISSDGRYLFTGDYRSFIYDRQERATIPINPGKQTCNASFSPDTGAYRMMFLNIGGPQNLENDKGTYEQHQIVYIVGVDNTVVQALDKNTVLPGRGEWQDPEWSNHPDYFVAVSKLDDGYDCFIVRIAPTPVVLQFNNVDYLRMRGDACPYLWIGRH